MYIMSFIYVSILPQIWAFVSSKKAKKWLFCINTLQNILSFRIH